MANQKEDSIENKLLKYQLPHFYQLEAILKDKNVALDASDTGTGKTYVAVALAYILKRKLFVICPKSVIPNWISVAKALGVELLGIANYEMIKGCKYYTSDLEKVNCKYMEVIQTINPSDVNKPDHKARKSQKDYVFNLPKDVLVIIDEAHRCKNHQTTTSRLLLSLYRSNCKMLLLSATITDKIICFKPFGVVFGFYDDIKKFKMWMRKIVKSREIYYRNKGLNGDQIQLDVIHSKIFPEFGSRMKIKDLGSMFPSNQILSQAYMSDNKEEIQRQYDIIKDAFEDLKKKETRSDGLGKLVLCKMKLEMLKLPIFLDIIEEGLTSNYSVAIFVNYTETLQYLAHYFESSCLVYGDQSMEEREDSINQFQTNKSNIIICNIRAGGCGVSLHDLHGGHPRMSVISPTWSGQDLAQCLGRIHRAGSKTPALQRIVFVAETFEERIMELIDTKLKNISGINDRDMIGPLFTDEEYEEIKKDLDEINGHILGDGSDIDIQNINEISNNIKRVNSIYDDSSDENNTENITENNEEFDDNEQNEDLKIIKRPNSNTSNKKFNRIVDKKEKRVFVKKNDGIKVGK